MRDDPNWGPLGYCEIADNEDKWPSLWEENIIVLNIFNESLGTARQILGEDKKTSFHMRPSEVEPLFRIHGVPQSEREEVMDGLLVLQEVWNKTRRPRK